VNDRWWLHLGIRADQEAGLWDAEKGANGPSTSAWQILPTTPSVVSDPATTNPPRGVPKFHHTFPQDPLNSPLGWASSTRSGPAMRTSFRLLGLSTTGVREQAGCFAGRIAVRTAIQPCLPPGMRSFRTCRMLSHDTAHRRQDCPSGSATAAGRCDL